VTRPEGLLDFLHAAGDGRTQGFQSRAGPFEAKKSLVIVLSLNLNTFVTQLEYGLLI
jgi:hypothetical protein